MVTSNIYLFFVQPPPNQTNAEHIFQLDDVPSFYIFLANWSYFKMISRNQLKIIDEGINRSQVNNFYKFDLLYRFFFGFYFAYRIVAYVALESYLFFLIEIKYCLQNVFIIFAIFKMRLF